MLPAASGSSSDNGNCREYHLNRTTARLGTRLSRQVGHYNPYPVLPVGRQRNARALRRWRHRGGRTQPQRMPKTTMKIRIALWSSTCQGGWAGDKNLNQNGQRIYHIRYYHMVADNGWSSVLNFQSVILGPPANAQAEAAACTGNRIEHARMSGTRKLVTDIRAS